MEVPMAGKKLSYIVAGILFLIGLPIIAFGLIYIWASFSANAQSGWIVSGIVTSCIGVILIGGGIGLIWLGGRSKPGPDNVTLKVDLPANVSMDTLKCKSCGGVLSPDNIQMVAGAPVVTCPYCGTTYQLTEEPKW
jgi:hypothetical protein